MPGPFMVEIVFCRVTRRGRKKRKGANKSLITDSKNDGPAFRFIPQEDPMKLSIDLSDDGPVFSALDDMMLKMIDQDAADRKNKASSDEAKKALKNLLRSGIPGIETMFAGNQGPQTSRKRTAGKLSGFQKKGFHKMTEQSKDKFMKAIFGKDKKEGEVATIDTTTAAALLAATYSGGDPNVGEKIAELLVPELGDKVDENMMAALMSSSSMISSGASTEDVMKCMQRELSKSGFSEEEILEKTKAVMKAFGSKGGSGGANDSNEAELLDLSLVSKQSNSALRQAQVSPKEFAKIVLCQRFLSAVDVSPENLAKLLIVQSQLVRRGAKPEHVAEVLKTAVGDQAAKAKQSRDLRPSTAEEKLKKPDVVTSVRLVEALENENEPSWKEVKQMKDILAGASTGSAEAIGLNLQRAIKSAGLSKMDMANTIQALKGISAIGVDPKLLANVLLTEKSISSNGVPPVEIARVFADGIQSADLFVRLAEQGLEAVDLDFSGKDVEAAVHIYEQLGLKSNVPEAVIKHVDEDLIQVRCSLEDVAENHVSSLLARGEKDSMIGRALCDTLRKTNASTEIIVATMFPVLKKYLGERFDDAELIKMTGRANVEAAINLNMDEILLAMKALQKDANSGIDEDTMKKSMESMLKDLQWFPDDIRAKILEVYPPPPKPVKAEAPPDDIDVLTADEIFKKFMTHEGGSSEGSSRRGSGELVAVVLDQHGERIGDENLAQLLIKKHQEQTQGGSRRGSMTALVVDTKKKKTKKKVKKKSVTMNAQNVSENGAVTMNGDQDGGGEESSSSGDEDEVEEMGLIQLDPAAIENLQLMAQSNQDFLLQDGDGNLITGLEGLALAHDHVNMIIEDDEEEDEDDEDIALEQVRLIANLSRSNSSSAPSRRDSRHFELAGGTRSSQEANAVTTYKGELVHEEEVVYETVEEDNEDGFETETVAGMTVDMTKTDADRGRAEQTNRTSAEERKTSKSSMKSIGRKDLPSIDEEVDEAKRSETVVQMQKKVKRVKKGNGVNGEANLPAETLTKIQNQLKEDASPKEVVQEALKQGASVNQALQIAKEQGASTEEIVHLQAKMLSEQSNSQTGLPSAALDQIKQQLPEATPIQIAQAALQSGASPAQAAQLAQAQGASPEELSQIQSQLLKATTKQKQQGISAVAMQQMQQKLPNATPEQIAQVAIQQGASLAQALELAKQQGADTKELAQIQKQVAAVKMSAAGKPAQGISVQALKEIQKQMPDSSPSSVAQAAMESGASLAQATQLALAQGATKEEVIQIQAQLASTNIPNAPKGLPQQELTNLQNNLQNASPSQIAQAAMKQGASLEQAAQLAQANGASVEEVIAIQSQLAASISSPREGISEAAAAQIQKKMSNSTPTELAQVALQQGASPTQVLQLAQAQGASKEDLAQIQADIIAQKPGLPSNALSQIQQQMPNASAAQIAQVAMQNGASSEQAIQLAKEQGATAKELASIQQSINASSQGLSDNALARLSQEMAQCSPTELAKVALQAGATPLQASQLAQSRGATVEEITNIQQQQTKGLPPQALANIQKKMSNASASELAMNAIQQGATPEQAMMLAQVQGASAEELQQISVQAKQSTTGLAPKALSKIQKKMSNASASEVAMAAMQQGATPEQAVMLAQAQGASQAELQQIGLQAQQQVAASSLGSQSSVGLSQQSLSQIEKKMSNASPKDIAKAAMQQGATAEQAVLLAQKQGASVAEIDQLKTQIANIPSQQGLDSKSMAAIQKNMAQAGPSEVAKVAMQQGATVNQALELAKAQGASAEEIKVLQQQMSSLRPQINVQNAGLSTAALTQIQQQFPNASPQEMAELAIRHGANPTQAMQMAQAQGATQQDLVQISAKLPATGLSTPALPNNQLAEIQKKMSGASPKEIASAAKQMGASPAQVLQLAQAQGATQQEMNQIQAALSQSVGAPPMVLKNIHQQMKGASPQEVAAVALKQGASQSQALQLAQAQGATQAELSQIKAALSPGISNSAMQQIHQQMKDATPDQIVAAAISQGASQTQALQLAQASGASGKELARIEEQIRQPSLPASSIDQLKVAMKNASPNEVVETALARGASVEQAAQLAQSLGVSKQEAAKLAQTTSNSMPRTRKTGATVLTGGGMDISGLNTTFTPSQVDASAPTARASTATTIPNTATTDLTDFVYNGQKGDSTVVNTEQQQQQRSHELLAEPTLISTRAESLTSTWSLPNKLADQGRESIFNASPIKMDQKTTDLKPVLQPNSPIADAALNQALINHRLRTHNNNPIEDNNVVNTILFTPESKNVTNIAIDNNFNSTFFTPEFKTDANPTIDNIIFTPPESIDDFNNRTFMTTPSLKSDVNTYAAASREDFSLPLVSTESQLNESIFKPGSITNATLQTQRPSRQVFNDPSEKNLPLDTTSKADRDYSYLFDDTAKSSGVELDRIRYRTAVPVEANQNEGATTGLFVSQDMGNFGRGAFGQTGGLEFPPQQQQQQQQFLDEQQGEVRERKRSTLDLDQARDTLSVPVRKRSGGGGENERSGDERKTSSSSVAEFRARRRSRINHNISEKAKAEAKITVYSELTPADSSTSSTAPSNSAEQRRSASVVSSYELSALSLSLMAANDAGDIFRPPKKKSVGSDVDLRAIRFRTVSPVRFDFDEYDQRARKRSRMEFASRTYDSEDDSDEYLDDETTTASTANKFETLKLDEPLHSNQGHSMFYDPTADDDDTGSEEPSLDDLADIAHYLTSNRAAMAGAREGELGAVGGGLSENEVEELLSVFKTEGILISKSGVNKFRSAEDIQTMIAETAEAFDVAYEEILNRPKTKISDVGRKKLEQLLKSKSESIESMRAQLREKRREAAKAGQEDTSGLMRRRFYNRDLEDMSSELYSSPYLKLLNEQRTGGQDNQGDSGARSRYQFIPDDELNQMKQSTYGSQMLSASARRRYLLRKQREEEEQQERERKAKEAEEEAKREARRRLPSPPKRELPTSASGLRRLRYQSTLDSLGLNTRRHRY